MLPTMRTHTVAITLFTLLSTLVSAECCDQSGGLSGECDDGSDASPCCGVGKCNMFCCNCDGGKIQKTAPIN